MSDNAPIRQRDPGPAEGPDLDRIRALTPARILAGRAGGSYRTSTHLELRADHAAARDAVLAGIDLARDLGEGFAARWGLFEARSRASSRQEFLVRPDLGRRLDDASREAIRRGCPASADLQVVIGDGLSATAVRAQVPHLLPLLHQESEARGWRWGRPFLVHHARVGILNDVGEILDPAVVVLLIGERPGLATAESLSAYMAFRPRSDHDDSRRNLISNIHGRGVSSSDAARRIVALAAQMMAASASGVAVKETGILPIPVDSHQGSIT
ncbi:ethanolamine ammonia-lyase subunit EutC [Aquisphaera insulae]|uniref:ethanolamine ammonia-lyase subunit EutC n=1 Tax=Aquisphaera insulae TaxID=2712864 RepID=UPI0013EE0243|nr:ethanolamine ammonia-lyase subunit EutC [Aquisphaera insulae]